jgi:hypothetical protein
VTLETISRFRVPGTVLDRTEAEIRAAGTDGYELFVLWTGVINGEAFDVITPHVPKQTSYRLDTGLCVRVAGEELHRLNIWMFDEGEILGVQLHSHPTDAYHSETDDAYPMVTLLGGLSIVVPQFGRGGIEGPGTAAYRLSPEGWCDVGAGGIGRVLEVVR